MYLNKQKLEETLSLYTNFNFNEGSLLKRKKFYDVILSEKANPMGDLIIFNSKTAFMYENIFIKIEDCINMFYTLPFINSNISAVMFHKLFLTHIAHILSQKSNECGIYVMGNDLFKNDDDNELPFTYSIIKNEDYNYMFYLGINIGTTQNTKINLSNFNLIDKEEICNNINEMFYNTLSQLFSSSFLI